MLKANRILFLYVPSRIAPLLSLGLIRSAFRVNYAILGSDIRLEKICKLNSADSHVCSCIIVYYHCHSYSVYIYILYIYIFMYYYIHYIPVNRHVFSLILSMYSCWSINQAEILGFPMTAVASSGHGRNQSMVQQFTKAGNIRMRTLGDRHHCVERWEEIVVELCWTVIIHAETLWFFPARCGGVL